MRNNMQKILRRRAFRELRANIFRYLSMGLLIILCMYLIISLVGAAETVIRGIDRAAEENHLEDGEFTVFVPLTDSQKKQMEEADIQLEEMFNMDYAVDGEDTLRLYKNRRDINLLDLDEGDMPSTAGQVVLEKRYCQENDLQVGDFITVGDSRLYIVGIGSVPDYDAPFKEISDSTVTSDRFGLAFVSEAQYEELKNTGGSEHSESYTYSYLLGEHVDNDDVKKLLQDFPFSADEVKDPCFQDYWERIGGKKDKIEDGVSDLEKGAGELSKGLDLLDGYQDGSYLYEEELSQAADGARELHEGTEELKEQTQDLLDQYFNVEIDNLTEFVPAKDNPRIRASADDQQINRVAGLIYGAVILVLFAYVISVFVIHNIEEEANVIGALYALGVRKGEIIRHYLTLPVTVTFVAGIVGTIAGFTPLGINVQMGDCYDYFSIPKLSTAYPSYLLVYGIIVPPVLAIIVSYLVMNRKLSQTALSLLRKEQKVKSKSRFSLGNLGFVNRFRLRHLIREMRSSLAVILGLAISLMVLLLGINCYVMCNNLKVQNREDTRYEYMYSCKYPDEKVPEDGEEAYAVGLKKERLGYNLDVTLLGIHVGNPYFSAQVKRGESRVVLSSAVSQKFDVAVGDQLVLTDEEHDRDYAFTVDDIVQYSPAMYVFMDIDSMRELFGQEDDYYNTVFSTEPLDIDAGKLYATVSKSEVAESSDIFVEMMMPMVIMLTVVSAMLFCLVMYLMMKVMIDRSSYGIALLRIFGYRRKEVRTLYLSENFWLIAAGAALALPLAKYAMDALYPIMVSNVACAMDLTYSWQLYLGIYVGILLLYQVIERVLVCRLNKITPAEILKDRE